MSDYLNHDQFMDRIHHELGVKRGPKKTRHPVSGYEVEVGKHPREIAGSSPPAERILDYGHFPGRGQQPRRGGFPQEAGTRPIKYVYRGVSEEDFRGIQQRGVIQSDQRGNLSCDEGTCASEDPHTAASYLPFGGQGRILKIRVQPEDNWRTDPRDYYIKTPNAIPADRIVRHSGVFSKDQMGRYLQ